MHNICILTYFSLLEVTYHMERPKEKQPVSKSFRIRKILCLCFFSLRLMMALLNSACWLRFLQSGSGELWPTQTWRLEGRQTTVSQDTVSCLAFHYLPCIRLRIPSLQFQVSNLPNICDWVSGLAPCLTRLWLTTTYQLCNVVPTTGSYVGFLVSKESTFFPLFVSFSLLLKVVFIWNSMFIPAGPWRELRGSETQDHLCDMNDMNLPSPLSQPRISQNRVPPLTEVVSSRVGAAADLLMGGSRGQGQAEGSAPGSAPGHCLY